MGNKKDKLDILLNLLLVLLGLIFLVAVILLSNYFLKGRQQQKMNNEILTLRQESLKPVTGGSENTIMQDSQLASEEEIESYRQTAQLLRQINPDYKCFLTLDEEHMYPVVQRDNAYYLKYNFQGERNSRGAIFMDENCSVEGAVYLIHGHHMKDWTMFGCLSKYMTEEYRKEHSIMYLDTGEGDVAYEVFAIGLFDLASEDHFQYYKLPNDENLNSYVEEFCKKSWWYEKIPKFDDLSLETKDIEDDRQTNPYMVLLSTCEYHGQDQRLVIAAKRMQ